MRGWNWMDDIRVGWSIEQEWIAFDVLPVEMLASDPTIELLSNDQYHSGLLCTTSIMFYNYAVVPFQGEAGEEICDPSGIMIN